MTLFQANICVTLFYHLLHSPLTTCHLTYWYLLYLFTCTTWTGQCCDLQHVFLSLHPSYSFPPCLFFMHPSGKVCPREQLAIATVDQWNCVMWWVDIQVRTHFTKLPFRWDETLFPPPMLNDQCAMSLRLETMSVMNLSPCLSLALSSALVH